MNPDVSRPTTRSPAKPATTTSLLRTAGGAIVAAAISGSGCQNVSSGEWSTKHQSMSVEKSAEVARQRDSARLPVPEIASPAEPATEEVAVVVEVPVETAPEPAAEPVAEPLPPPEPQPNESPVGETDAPPPAAVIVEEPALPDPMTASTSPHEAAARLLSTATNSPYAALRANAIEGLAKAPDVLRPLLGRALVDTNRGVRFVAANVVAKAGLCDQSALLEPLVRDESDSVRAGAIAGLVECGVRVDQSPLAGMLRSDDPEIRANAYLALGLIGNRSSAPMIRESLGKGMRLVNSLRVKLVEIQGGEALVRLGDTAEIEPIRAALFAPGEQGELTVLACQILGRLGDQQSQGALFRLSRPSGEDVRPIEIRLAALRALADLGVPDRAQLLQSTAPYLKDLSPMVRAQACFTVGAIGGDAAVQALVPLMADLDPNVQVAAAGAILTADSRR